MDTTEPQVTSTTPLPPHDSPTTSPSSSLSSQPPSSLHSDLHQEGEEQQQQPSSLVAEEKEGSEVAVNTLSQTVEESSQLQSLNGIDGDTVLTDLPTTDRQAAPTADQQLKHEDQSEVNGVAMDEQGDHSAETVSQSSEKERTQEPIDNSTEPKKEQPSPIQISDPLSTDSSQAPEPHTPHIDIIKELNTVTEEKGTDFTGINYLGSSTVDAPVSETEANRKMLVLKTQAGQSIPIILSVPYHNGGSIVLRDPQSNQTMVAFLVRHVLFCARGHVASDLCDCFAINVLHKRSGVYNCHVFQCAIPDACQKVFESIGQAFKHKPTSANAASHNELAYNLEVFVEIYEEDGKGNFSLVSTDKDCLKLRIGSKKKIVVVVSQSSRHHISLEKCYGMLMAVGKDVKKSDLNQLDNMQCSGGGGGDSVTFTVAGFFDTTLPFLSSLAEETQRVKHLCLTIAVDLVAEGIPEPIRIIREVKVRSVKSETFGSIGSRFATLTKKRLPAETFVLVVEKVTPDGKRKVKSLKSMRELREAASASLPPSSDSPLSPRERHHDSLALQKKSSDDTPSPTASLKGKLGGRAAKVKELDQTAEDSDNVEEVDEFDFLVSGWGDPEMDLSEDLLKQWGDLLEKWDGREKWDPNGDKPRNKQLVKLVRKGIPSPLRCQIWQMLSGAESDPQLMEAYRLLVTKESAAENVIHWDIKRTYVGHEYFKEESGKDALYKISKAYSVYDEEVGYCQGFSFMAAVLLIQKMPEEQAFAVLVKLMFHYGHRNLFKCNFQVLHLMFYQLERLMDEYLHELYEHMRANQVETHMYASQWFLTIFTAKFSLSVIFQIMDIYLCEGCTVVFRIALALLKLTQKDLLALDFEGILNYFRVSLPRKISTEDECRLLFDTANSFKVTQRKLKKLEKDYQNFLDQQSQLEDPVVRIECENKRLAEEVLRLQRENDDLAEELVSSKVALRVDMDTLEERIDTLSKENRACKSQAGAANLLISELKEELQQAKQTYQTAMIQLTEERQRHDAAINEYKLVFKQMDEGNQKQTEELNQELLEVKAKLSSVSSAQASGVILSDADHLSSLTSEQKLQELELNLAQTKLQLVESQCKNQELEHRIQELNTELIQSKKRTTWRPRFN